MSFAGYDRWKTTEPDPYGLDWPHCSECDHPLLVDVTRTGRYLYCNNCDEPTDLTLE